MVKLPYIFKAVILEIFHSPPFQRWVEEKDVCDEKIIVEKYK